MSPHNAYLIVLGAVFALAFAIMIGSLARHRRGVGDAAPFSGPSGGLQWLWAMVPIAILAGINVALIETPRQPIAATRIALAVTPATAPGTVANGARNSDGQAIRQAPPVSTAAQVVR